MAGALQVTEADIERITHRLFLSLGDRQRNLTAFWVLLVLAAVIASAGVVADSTATVIGAMIVAPLMTPILGTALAIVLADRRQLASCLVLVVGASVAVVAVGFLVGLTIPVEVVAENNSQVASRVSPKLIDLVAAVATGLVGAFALIRSDVSDTLPGVAIAISLVPPLAVVGLTLESGAGDQARGALLLFGTNVAAIIATGTVLLLVSELRSTAIRTGAEVGRVGGRSLAAVAASLLLVAVPLGIGSVSVLRDQQLVSTSQPVVHDWAQAQEWTVTDLTVRNGRLRVEAVGLLPEPDTSSLRKDLDDAGLGDVAVDVELLLGGQRTLEGG
ncbi:DUF389 domain-containing protein [Nocardioides sp. GXQ0305]|uniref:DUF389 domain-containing protein n=1 Tax=Nocardioides sp. GXQ0305 TaxID=3423912 RepID=UPI003D7DEFA8